MTLEKRMSHTRTRQEARAPVQDQIDQEKLGSELVTQKAREIVDLVKNRLSALQVGDQMLTDWTGDYQELTARKGLKTGQIRYNFEQSRYNLSLYLATSLSESQFHKLAYVGINQGPDGTFSKGSISFWEDYKSVQYDTQEACEAAKELAEAI